MSDLLPEGLTLTAVVTFTDGSEKKKVLPSASRHFHAQRHQEEQLEPTTTTWTATNRPHHFQAQTTGCEFPRVSISMSERYCRHWV